MHIAEMNKKASALLEEWDPFPGGPVISRHEIVQLLRELERLDHPSDLAKRIRDICKPCCGLWIPLEDCMEISYKLLAVKYEAKCIIS